EINTQKCENSGDNEEQEINSQESSHVDYQQKRSIQDICKDLDDLERGLRLLPTRRITKSSPGIKPWVRCAFCGRRGIHYSDSCPDFPDGDQRYRLILQDDRCVYCLERCNPYVECREQEKAFPHPKRQWPPPFVMHYTKFEGMDKKRHRRHYVVLLDSRIKGGDSNVRQLSATTPSRVRPAQRPQLDPLNLGQYSSISRRTTVRLINISGTI
ncbi:hypothetical protein OSTOST_00566, partial [Ostertagia ostertagi]